MRDITILILISLSFFACSPEKKAEQRKPNIIFLIADDQSFKDLGSYNSEVITPNMDSLIRRGVHFTHAYNMGSDQGAVCIASRSMMITGRKLWELQETVKKNYDTSTLLPLQLKNAGYHTQFVGKWHVFSALPEEVFDEVGQRYPGMPKDTAIAYNRPLSKQDTAWLPWKKELGGYWKGGTHWSEVLRNNVIEFIKKNKELKQPFFLYAGFNAPHDPRQSPKQFNDLYHIDSLKLPQSYLPEYPYKEEMGAGKSLRDERLAPFPRTELAVKTHRKEYFAITSHLDEQIGLIIDELEKNGMMENTYIFFTSDHGLAVGEHGLFGKQNMYDHSIRVPFAIIGPGLEKGKKVDTDIYLQDAMATALELAGIEKPDVTYFHSLLNLANGKETASNYPAIYGAYEPASQRMIRKQDFKLIVYPKAKKMRLYDLKNDPQELNDLAENEEYKEKVKTLYKELILLQKKMADTLDLSNYFK